MTEAEALDEAARAAGMEDWRYFPETSLAVVSIRAHAKTIMENAALKRENEALMALQEGDGELLTIAWMDGAHRSNKAHREQVAALKAENERLREALGLLSAVELTIPADRIRDDDHVIITYKTFRALRTALERIDHD